jgi:hypothetical protein
MEEIGVIVLMFLIGLHVSGNLIRRMGALMLGGGAALAFVGYAAEGNYYDLLELRRYPRYARKIAAHGRVQFRVSSEAKLNRLRVG